MDHAKKQVKEGSEIVTNCDKLKLVANDGKLYLTDVADIETVFQLVQSLPSKKLAKKKHLIKIKLLQNKEVQLRAIPGEQLKKKRVRKW